MRVIRTIVNDIYYSLIPLYYPPSLLAYTALYMSSVYDQKNITFIFGANDIDMNDIYNINMFGSEIFYSYENNKPWVTFKVEFSLCNDLKNFTPEKEVEVLDWLKDVFEGVNTYLVYDKNEKGEFYSIGEPDGIKFYQEFDIEHIINKQGD